MNTQLYSTNNWTTQLKHSKPTNGSQEPRNAVKSGTIQGHDHAHCDITAKRLIIQTTS